MGDVSTQPRRPRKVLPETHAVMNEIIVALLQFHRYSAEILTGSMRLTP